MVCPQKWVYFPQIILEVGIVEVCLMSWQESDHRYLLVFIVIFSITCDSTAQFGDTDEVGHLSKEKETVGSS